MRCSRWWWFLLKCSRIMCVCALHYENWLRNQQSAAAATATTILTKPQHIECVYLCVSLKNSSLKSILMSHHLSLIYSFFYVENWLRSSIYAMHFDLMIPPKHCPNIFDHWIERCWFFSVFFFPNFERNLNFFLLKHFFSSIPPRTFFKFDHFDWCKNEKKKNSNN